MEKKKLPENLLKAIRKKRKPVYAAKIGTTKIETFTHVQHASDVLRERYPNLTFTRKAIQNACSGYRKQTGGYLFSKNESELIKKIHEYKKPERVLSKPTHNMKNTRIYRMWVSMKQKCRNPNDNLYYLYGARGITYCEDWEKFIPFYEDMKDAYNEAVEKYGKPEDVIFRIHLKEGAKVYNKENAYFAM